MEPGQQCCLCVADPQRTTTAAPTTAAASALSVSSPSPNASSSSSDDPVTVSGVVVAVRPHAEEPQRLLGYFRCTHVDLCADLTRQKRKAASLTSWSGASFGAIGSGTVHRGNELRVGTNSFVSADGYHYRYDGWYDASDLRGVSPAQAATPQPTRHAEAVVSQSAAVKEEKNEEEKGGEGVDKDVRRSPQQASQTAISTVGDAGMAGASTTARVLPEEWVNAAERDTAVCEIVYLCYAFRPWFPAPYTALQYLALPENDVCHSVYICHRCLSPFFTREQYFVHLEGGYCALRRPPGSLLYHDADGGYKAYLVDGAKHLHYCRCLSLLGKHFIESKLVSNDVDLYEYVVVTVPRAALPYCAETCGVDAAAFQQAAAAFDAAEWDGDVVAGYFSRRKHHPNHTLSCIVTFPIFQRMRLATFQLDLAYWMTGQRQRRCGAATCCGRGGGAISRPFSPHGQSLLLAYWRRALLRGLGDAAPRRRSSARTATAATTADATFTFDELKALMAMPIHADDLQLLLLHSEFTFYSASAASDSADGGVSAEKSETSGDSRASPPSPQRKGRRESTNHSDGGGGGGRSRSASARDAEVVSDAVASGQRYTTTMVLESALLQEAAQTSSGRGGRPAYAVFEKRWLVKDGRGGYAYDFAHFHY